MVGRHPQFKEHEFEQALEDDEGQGTLMCCSSQGRKELNTTQQESESVTAW